MAEPLEHIHIRRMMVEDIPQVHELERQSFTAPWDVSAYYREVANPSSYYLVAHQRGRIVGFGGMWVIADEAHVVTLAVHEEFRRRGLGRRLMEDLLDEARRRQVLFVTLEVRVSNFNAQRLYLSLGFRPTYTRRHYYPDNGEDALVMLLEFPPAGTEEAHGR